MKNNSIYFFQKIQKIISWIAFIFFPAMIALIVMNFNVFALVFTILAGLLFSTCIYYIHNNKTIILKDKMIYYGFRKIEFEYPRVQSVELHNKRYIKIVYDNKKYVFAGFIDFLLSVPNEQKNIELINKLNDTIKQYKKQTVNNKGG